MLHRLAFTLCLTLVVLMSWAASGHAATKKTGLLSTTARHYCTAIGALAEQAARLRDKGIPLTSLLAIRPEEKEYPELSTLVDRIQFDVYKHSWWSPSYARQQWELACVEARRAH